MFVVSITNYFNFVQINLNMKGLFPFRVIGAIYVQRGHLNIHFYNILIILTRLLHISYRFAENARDYLVLRKLERKRYILSVRRCLSNCQICFVSDINLPCILIYLIFSINRSSDTFGIVQSNLKLDLLKQLIQPLISTGKAH